MQVINDRRALTGWLEPDQDGDFWADHDEDCHGTIDTEENKEEYPEGFVWTCCDKLGDELKGCREGKHVAENSKRARNGGCVELSSDASAGGRFDRRELGCDGFGRGRGRVGRRAGVGHGTRLLYSYMY